MTHAGVYMHPASGHTPTVMHKQARTPSVAADRRRPEPQFLGTDSIGLLGVAARALAHELRNPMSAASAAAQLLLDGPADEALRLEAAQIVHASIARASRMIESLLEFAPADHRMEATRLGPLLTEIVRSLRPRIAAAHVRVRTSVERGLPAVAANRRLLRAALGNLMLGACDAMPDGGTLTVSARADGRETVEVAIQATGRATRGADLEDAFRLLPASQALSDGVHVGVALGYRIILSHGGTVQVSSETGRGGRFTVRLPGRPRATVRE
ncbi:MAG: histidine kinase dimerization/phospho-acceptor domain-containing protein [Armatimonadota bacterium]|nr:histidine kinase dimerization/phospho-acceptor domain-containing protein [Armatimonadota bacterium]